MLEQNMKFYTTIPNVLLLPIHDTLVNVFPILSIKQKRCYLKNIITPPITWI